MGSADPIPTRTAEREHLAAIVDSSDDPILSLDLEGRIITWNRGAERLYGWPASEACGAPLTLIMPEHSAELARILACVRAGQPDRIDATERMCRDGGRVTVSVTVTPLRDGHGRLVGAASIERNLAKGQERYSPAEEAVRRSEERLRLVVEAALDAVITIDLRGLVTGWNAQAEAMFGWNRAEILGKTLLETIIPPDFRAAHARGLDRFRETGEGPALNRRMQITALRRSGEIFPVELTITPLSWGRQTLAFSAFVRDITEQKRAADDLQRAAKEIARSNVELEQFAYVASHDLQEPLRMITSYLQLLGKRRGDELDPDSQRYLAFAADGAKRMQTMVQDLLEYSRIGGQTACYQMVDSSSALEEALANLGAAIEQSGGTIIREGLPKLKADRTQLILLFQNLVGNAIKFRGVDPPRVHISAERRGDEWLFRIADNGIGVDPCHKDHIFGLFRRLHTSAEYPGTGMGLAICKKIVEHHGGGIRVESSPGAGSTFLFTLPA